MMMETENVVLTDEQKPKNYDDIILKNIVILNISTRSPSQW